MRINSAKDALTYGEDTPAEEGTITITMGHPFPTLPLLSWQADFEEKTPDKYGWIDKYVLKLPAMRVEGAAVAIITPEIAQEVFNTNCKENILLIVPTNMASEISPKAIKRAIESHCGQ